jgi:hypothetical protein
MSFLIPTITVPVAACAPGVPATPTTFVGQTATALSIRNPLLATDGVQYYYTILAGFPAGTFGFNPACAALQSITFATAGPLAILQQLQLATSDFAATASASLTSPPSTTTGPSTSQQSGTTSTRSPTPPGPVHNSGKGLGGGPAAGLAIGCLAAGALIAALVFFLCGLRRRKNAASGENGAITNVGNAGLAPYNVESKGVGVSTMQLPLGSAGAIVESNTKDPVADADLKAEFSRINDQQWAGRQPGRRRGRRPPAWWRGWAHGGSGCSASRQPEGQTGNSARHHRARARVAHGLRSFLGRKPAPAGGGFYAAHDAVHYSVRQRYVPVFN